MKTIIFGANGQVGHGLSALFTEAQLETIGDIARAIRTPANQELDFEIRGSNSELLPSMPAFPKDYGRTSNG